MKKIFSLFVAMIFVFLAVACSDTEEPADKKAQSESGKAAVDKAESKAVEDKKASVSKLSADEIKAIIDEKIATCEAATKKLQNATRATAGDIQREFTEKMGTLNEKMEGITEITEEQRVKLNAAIKKYQNALGFAYARE